MSKKMFHAACVCLALAAVPAVSDASCAVTGIVVRVTSYDSSYNGVSAAYIYMKASTLSSNYYYAYSEDATTITNAVTYLNSGRTITLVGDSGCPGVPPAGGSASVGNVSYTYTP